MTTAIGIGLMALVIATLAVFVAAWRWLTRPAISEETIEALWNVIAELHDAVYRLEMNVAKLERMMAASNDKRSRITERSEGGEDW
jgi:phage shock protein A